MTFSKWFLQDTQSAGYSLIETLIVLGLVGVLAAFSLPLFSPTSGRVHVRAAASQLRSDLQEARTQAMQASRPIYLRFWRSSDGRAWCWGISEQPACDCRLTAVALSGICRLSPDAAPRTVSSHEYRGVLLDALPFSGELRLSPVRADLVAGHASFSLGRAGPSLRVVVSALGRVRLCTPTGVQVFSGFASC